MRCYLAMAFLGSLLACSPPVEPASTPVVLPEWVELNDARMLAEVRHEPGQLSLPVFSPFEEGRPRLLVYAFPQVQRLTLPGDGVRRDIAFFDVGGRVIDLYPSARCDPGAPCVPLPSRFAATSVLVAPEGTLDRFKMKRSSQMRWYETGRVEASITPLASP